MSEFTRRLRALWNRAAGVEPDEAPVSPIEPEGIDIDSPCPTCHDVRTILVEDDDGGGRVRIPCPDCAPNDALGG